MWVCGEISGEGGKVAETGKGKRKEERGRSCKGVGGE